MTTKQELENEFAALQEAVTSACNLVDVLRQENAVLREALQDLYDAMPVGYGEDRALNEALIAAEKALGIAHSEERPSVSAKRQGDWLEHHLHVEPSPNCHLCAGAKL
jgi:hypothetical protein